MTAFPCWADNDPVSVAKKYVDALQNKSKQAFLMLTPKTAKMGQSQFDQLVRFSLGKGMPGLAGVQIDTTVFSKSTETHALVVVAKKVIKLEDETWVLPLPERKRGSLLFR